MPFFLLQWKPEAVNAFEFSLLFRLTLKMKYSLILFLLFAFNHVGNTQQSKTIRGEVLVIEGPINQKVWLKTGQDYVVVNETNQEIRFKTGTFIKGVYNETSVPLNIRNVSVYLPNSLYSLQIKSITYILSICDKTNPLKARELRTMWFNNVSSLQSAFNRCSWGTSSFTEENNIIVGPITIPCNLYDLTQCNGMSLYGIVDYADSYAMNNLRINVSKFNRRIVMLPSIDTCSWAGLGNVGCGSKCMVWINGLLSLRLSTVFHELGHTLGLLHSSRDNNGYGDDTCAMGISLSDNACYNSAHNYLLGWSTPIAVLENVTVPYTIKLPAFMKSKSNMIRVGNIFISFTGEDNMFQNNSYINKLLVHSSANTGIPEYHPTSLLAVLDVGKRVAVGAFSIEFVSVSDNTALVTIQPSQSSFG